MDKERESERDSSCDKISLSGDLPKPTFFEHFQHKVLVSGSPSVHRTDTRIQPSLHRSFPHQISLHYDATALGQKSIEICAGRIHQDLPFRITDLRPQHEVLREKPSGTSCWLSDLDDRTRCDRIALLPGQPGTRNRRITCPTHGWQEAGVAVKSHQFENAPQQSASTLSSVFSTSASG